MRLIVIFLVILILQLIYLQVPAQSFKLMRYDENYAVLKDSTHNFYRSIKYLPLGSNNIYVSFGGEARLEYVSFNNEDWGKSGIGHNNFLLQRYDVLADVHFASRVRLFAQVRSALQGGRKNGSRPIDEDQLNLQNFFIDVRLWDVGNGSFIMRAGKQEIDYGSGRLISVREGPNARISFNGVKFIYNRQSWQLDAFVFAMDSIRTGVFDNKTSKQANLWGGYARKAYARAGNIDLYYLGIRRDAATFEEGTQKEIRHTLGARYWKYGDGFIYNFEAAWQFGHFGSGVINAWTGSMDVGYIFSASSWTPAINIRNDYISGDKIAGDGNLQTFNPLYPKGGYFGFDPQIGPVNLIDIHPYFTCKPLNVVTLQCDIVCNWRYSAQDGLYRPSGSFNLGGAGSAKKYIGTAWLASILYTPNKFLTANIGMQYFQTGTFIDDVIPASKNGLFINTRLGFKF